jgi:hypothetical protein
MEIDLSETIPLLPRERALTFPFSWKSKQCRSAQGGETTNTKKNNKKLSNSRGFPVFVVNPRFILSL